MQATHIINATTNAVNVLDGVIWNISEVAR